MPRSAPPSSDQHPQYVLDVLTACFEAAERDLDSLVGERLLPGEPEVTTDLLSELRDLWRPREDGGRGGVLEDACCPAGTFYMLEDRGIAKLAILVMNEFPDVEDWECTACARRTRARLADQQGAWARLSQDDDPITAGLAQAVGGLLVRERRRLAPHRTPTCTAARTSPRPRGAGRPAARRAAGLRSGQDPGDEDGDGEPPGEPAPSRLRLTLRAVYAVARRPS